MMIIATLKKHMQDNEINRPQSFDFPYWWLQGSCLGSKEYESEGKSLWTWIDSPMHETLSRGMHARVSLPLPRQELGAFSCNASAQERCPARGPLRIHYCQWLRWANHDLSSADWHTWWQENLSGVGHIGHDGAPLQLQRRHFWKKIWKELLTVDYYLLVVVGRANFLSQNTHSQLPAPLRCITSW
jgi:hypothetical protein